MSRFFLETRFRQFREGSVVNRQLSYRIDRMAIVRCRFIFLGIDGSDYSIVTYAFWPRR